jgi:hypothetical protein
VVQTVRARVVEPVPRFLAGDPPTSGMTTGCRAGGRMFIIVLQNPRGELGSSRTFETIEQAVRFVTAYFSEAEKVGVTAIEVRNGTGRAVYRHSK